jgi:TolB-like protein/Tfp pilus assembly protein PilF
MGEVYRALDPHLRREVAIKILPADGFSDPERRKRLELEARAAGALNHPNLLTIYDLGTEDGAPFIVSELLVGQTLRSALAGGALPCLTATTYAVQIAAGLEAAHEKGIIHRDLKPENIFVTTDGRVKILDFGLAKFIESRAQNDSTQTLARTAPGTVMGTLAYMAPEQVKALSADERSDIFAFGSILFEMLWGRPAFRRQSAAETIAAILTADPLVAPPGDVPPGLMTVLRYCLNKEPGRRFQTVHDLAFALGYDRVDPVTVPMVAPRANPRMLIAGSVVVAILAIAAVVVPRLGPRTEDAAIDSIAVLPLRDLDGGTDHYFADGLTEDLASRLAQIHALRVVAPTSTSRFVDTKRSLREIGRELNVAAILTGSVQRSGNKVRVTIQLSESQSERSLLAERYERPIEDVLTLQDVLARTIAERIRVRMTPSEQHALTDSRPVDPAALEAYLRGRSYLMRSDPESLSRGLLYFKEAVRRDPGYAAAYAGIAHSYREMAMFGVLVSTEAFPVAKDAAVTAIRLDPNLAEAHVSLGSVATLYDWNWKSAEEAFRRAIELNPSYDLAHNEYAHLLIATGRPEEAVAQSRRAFELSPLGRQAIVQLPWMLYMARQYEASILQYQKAMELDPDGLVAREGAGDAYAAASRNPEAFAQYQQWARMAGYPQPILDDLARAYASEGMAGYWRKRLEMEKIEMDQTGDVFAYRMASLHARVRETNEALDWLERAYAEHHSRLIYLRVDPVFDSVRREPRFQNLIDRIGLPVPVV